MFLLFLTQPRSKPSILSLPTKQNTLPNPQLQTPKLSTWVDALALLAAPDLALVPVVAADLAV